MPTPIPFSDLLVSGFTSWYDLGLNGVLIGLLILVVSGVVIKKFS